MDQAQSACPADGAGTQGTQTSSTKQAGTGTTCSPTKAAPKAAPQTARKKPSEEYNLEALIEIAYEYRGGEPKAADDGSPQAPNKRSRKEKDDDDEEGMSDGEQDSTH